MSVAVHAVRIVARGSRLLRPNLLRCLEAIIVSGTVYRMNLSEYMLLSREERISHIDLEDPCICYTRECRKRSRKKLLEYLSLLDDKPEKVQCCHLCNNVSISSTPCINPRHLYFGTAQENILDIPVEARSSRSVHGGRAVHSEKDEDGKSVRAKVLGKHLDPSKGGKALHSVKDSDGKSVQGKKNAQKLHAQRWICLETGKVMDPGNLTQYQRRNGIDASKRKRIA